MFLWKHDILFAQIPSRTSTSARSLTSKDYIHLEYALRVCSSIVCRGCARPEMDMAVAHSFHIHELVQSATNDRRYCNNLITNKMKRNLLLCMLSMMFLTSFAQKVVTVKAGTLIPFQAVNQVAAADVSEGEKVLFRVSRDINVDGVTAIPYGTMVNGTVYQAKKSSWWGTRGRLGILINEIVLSDGTVVPIQNADIKIKGKNRTAIAVVAAVFYVVPGFFITGSKAEMPINYEIQGNVGSNTVIKVQ